MTDTKNLPALESAGDNLTLGQMFSSILDIVKDPEVDPAKAAALLEIQERMIDRQARMDFNRAKMQAMLEMPRIDRNGRVINHKTKEIQSRYARFEDIDRIVRPICAKNGLVYSFNVKDDRQGGVSVTCELGHIGGHVEHYGPMFVPLDTTGSKNSTQGSGSALSYGKRYTLSAALNIVTEKEDDDGQSATKRPAMPGDEAWHDKVQEEAHEAALKGSAAYAEWFKSLSPMRKGWLVELGGHEDFKAQAEQMDQAGGR